jgi:hypothetical protein
MNPARSLQLFIAFCTCSLIQAYVIDYSCSNVEARVDAALLEARYMAALAAGRIARVAPPGAPADMDNSKEQLWYGFEQADLLDLRSKCRAKHYKRSSKANITFLQTSTARLVNCLF